MVSIIIVVHNYFVCVIVMAHELYTCVLITMLFIEGVSPDGRPEIVLNSILPPIAITVDLLALIGILFAIVCLLFNIIFRERA